MVISTAVPGPGVFACIARAIASGFKATLYIIGGILIGNVAFLIDVNHLSWADGLMSIGVISTALFLVLVVYSYGAARARGLLNSRRALKRCNQSAGTLMIGTGVYIAVRQT